MLIQSYISHRRGRVFNPVIIFLSFFSLSWFIDLLQKVSGIIENIIFSLIFILRKIWYVCQMRKITKIWYLLWTFIQKCCFSCSVTSCKNILASKIHFSSWDTSIQVETKLFLIFQTILGTKNYRNRMNFFSSSSKYYFLQKFKYIQWNFLNFELVSM